MARRNENPKSVVRHPLPTPRDSSDMGRMDTGGSTPAAGSEKEKVSATAIPEKRGVREPDQNFPALRGQVEERVRGDAGTSATTSDEEMHRNPRPPKRLRRHRVIYGVGAPRQCPDIACVAPPGI